MSGGGTTDRRQREPTDGAALGEGVSQPVFSPKQAQELDLKAQATTTQPAELPLEVVIVVQPAAAAAAPDQPAGAAVPPPATQPPAEVPPNVGVQQAPEVAEAPAKPAAPATQPAVDAPAALEMVEPAK